MKEGKVTYLISLDREDLLLVKTSLTYLKLVSSTIRIENQIIDQKQLISLVMKVNSILERIQD